MLNGGKSYKQNNESYTGTILNIDCKTRVTPKTATHLLEPVDGFDKSRIKIRYGGSMNEGYELVNVDLSKKYVGTKVTVNNNTYRNQDGNIVRKQEIVSLDGLERIVIQVVSSD